MIQPDLGLPWWVWGIVANIGIAVTEYLNRTGKFGSFLEALPYTALPIVIAQMGLLYAWRGAPSLMIAWVAFTTGNSVLRIINARVFVAEPLTVWAYVGVGTITLGGYLITFWGRPPGP